MLKSLKNLNYSLNRRLEKVGERTSEVIRWSTLKKFTSSRPAQLTILAPLVGYLIIFNAELQELLRLDLPGDRNEAQASWIHSNSLSFLYFGLIFYGLGVAVFSVFCPRQIKDSANIYSYVGSMEEVKTPNLVRRHLSEVISRFLAYNEGEQQSPFFAVQSLSFPSFASQPLHLLVERLASLAFDDPEVIVGFQTGTGHWKTDEIMELMFSERRVDRVFSEPFFEAANNLSKEVFYLSFRAFDYSGFWLRVSAVMFFSLGLTLLAIPTVSTCVTILID